MSNIRFTMKDLDGTVMPYTSFVISTSTSTNAASFTTNLNGEATVTLAAVSTPYYISKQDGTTESVIAYKFFVPDTTYTLDAELLFVDMGKISKDKNDKSIAALIEAKVVAVNAANRALQAVSLLGNVSTIRDNLDSLVQVANSVENVVTVANNIESIVSASDGIASISSILPYTANIANVANRIESLVAVGNNINNINDVRAMESDIAAIADNIASITDAAAAVTQAIDAQKELYIAGTHYTRGVSATLNLSYTPAKTKSVKVFFDGIYQNKNTFTRVGTAITFSEVLNVDTVEIHYEVPSQFVSLDDGDNAVLVAAQNAAQASANAAAASFDSFDDRYLGAKTVAPTLDNDGNVLLVGAKYFNSTENKMYVRNSSNVWQLDTAESSAVNYLPAGTGAVATGVQSKLRESVSVKDFGAVGDGVTDDTAAIQAALDTGIKEIIFSSGCVFKLSTCTIKTRGQSITGGGTVNGQIAVAMPKGTDIYTTIIAEVSIHNLVFSGSSTTTNSILLRRGRGIRISDCTFREVNVCVLVQPWAEDYDGGSHCIEDVMILNNTATMVNYFLYGDTSGVITGGVNWWMGCSDITVSKNTCRVSKVSFIHADRMDGLIVEGNTALNWGFSGAMPGKLHGVYISTQGAQVIIKGNNIFETGYEGVRLLNCSSVIIEGNNIVQCGQLKPSSAICVSNNSAGQNTFLSIQNNLINEISSHPISVGNVKIGSVQGNTAYIGSRAYYYGSTPLVNVDSLFLVNLEGTNEGLVIGGNSCPELITRGINPASTGRTRPAAYKYDVNSAVTSLDGTADRIHLNSGTAHTISTVTGGYDGQVITLVTFTGNCTIGDAGTVSGGNILTDTGSNKVLQVNRLYCLTKAGGAWYLK